MLKNYFKIAFRNLARNKVHSFINIAGLSVGMAVAILIGLWIYDELSFDHYHKHYDRIARLKQNLHVNGEIQTDKMVPYPLARELQSSYGNYFKYVVMSSNRANHVLAAGDKKLIKFGVYLEPDAPEMLTLKMLKGTRAGLNDPYSILLSASAAEVFFGINDPINQIIQIDSKQQVKVTGVYEDLPANTTFASLKFIAPFELYLNNSPWISNNRQSWERNTVQTYVQFADDADMEQVSALIRDIKQQKISKEEARYKPALLLEPMTRWHLYSDYKNGVNAGGKIRDIWTFGIIGIFVLLLACINFMNLSTARSEKRAREVGIRKAIGSLRSQLIWQFFSESLLIVAASFAGALLLATLLLPLFNEIANKKMNILWAHPLFWLAGIGFCLVTGLIAGSYPALYLSSFQPSRVLKGAFRAGRFATMPRKGLVILQFTVSVTLIICTITVFRQVQFAKERPIGYSRDGLITVPLLTNDIARQFDLLKEDLLKTGVITGIAGSQAPATDIWGTENELEWEGKDPQLTIDFPTTGVSVDYGKTMGWQFIQGRDFSSAFATDSSSFVLNEAAVRFMGLKNPVGQTIKWEQSRYTVVGVIRDMIVESPYEQVRPSLYRMYNAQPNFLMLRINPSISPTSALHTMATIFRQYNPSVPFDYSFVDEDYARKFGNEERVARLAGIFAILAIFISCIGLFGMASFMAERRVKEIGVRKVLGASVFNVWQLLSKEFVILVLISLVIAAPIAYSFMQNWLQHYQYRSGISWWIFIVAGLGAMLITILTVSFQAIKAGMANPVKSLKME